MKFALLLSFFVFSTVHAYEIKNTKVLQDKKLEKLASNIKEICSDLSSDLEYCEVIRLSLNNVKLENETLSLTDLRNYMMKNAMEMTSDNYDDVTLESKYIPMPGTDNDRRNGRTQPETRFNTYYKDVFYKLANQDKARLNKLKRDVLPYLNSKTHRLAFFFNSVHWASYDGFFIVDNKNQEALLITSVQNE